MPPQTVNEAGNNKGVFPGKHSALKVLEVKTVILFL